MEEGVYVLVERDSSPLHGGEVDEITNDASVVWIWLDGGRGRIALFEDEGTRVWLPKGYELAAFEGSTKGSVGGEVAVSGDRHP